MTINPTNKKPRTANGGYGFEWADIAEAVRAQPGVVFEVTNTPTISSSDIRTGVRLAFAPAGAFDAWREGGTLHVVYLGEPVEPWVPWSGVKFADIARVPLDGSAD